LLLLTGCRRDELAELIRDELSDDCAIIRLPGERTKKPHDVLLPPFAIEVMRRRRERTPEGCRYLFSTNGRTPVSGFSKIKPRLDAAMLALARSERGEDFVISPWRIHDLRRTCSTGMGDIGIAPHIIEAVINHISGTKGGVAGVYNRACYETEKREAWRVGDLCLDRRLRERSAHEAEGVTWPPTESPRTKFYRCQRPTPAWPPAWRWPG
jgi:integrase